MVCPGSVHLAQTVNELPSILFPLVYASSYRDHGAIVQFIFSSIYIFAASID